MAAAASPHGAATKLQATHSARSAGSAVSSTFVKACPAGALDPLGLPPIARVSARPASANRHPKKPSALDKHLRHVILLQRFNKHKAHQHAVTAQHKHRQHQRFADWGHRLRNAILGRGSENTTDCQDSGTGPAASSAAAAAGGSAAAAAGDKSCCSSDAQPHQQQDGCADVIQSWRPVAAAARTRELQESLTLQQQSLRATLPAVLDPKSLRPNHKLAQQQAQQQSGSNGACSSPSSPGKAQHTHAAADQRPAHQRPACAAAAGQDQEEDTLDVDAFLDGLLQSASTQHPSAQQGHLTTSAKPQPRKQQQRPGSSCSSKGARPVPAWAVSEQQAAAAEAPAAEAEEASLLTFAQGLDWQELLQDVGDDDLAAAFKELELADGAAAEGQPDADKRWQQCFVTALNAAAMKGIADGNTAAAGGAAGEAGSQQGDKRSFVSSASALRRQEAAATRRQQLIHRLHRLTGAALPQAAAAAAGAAAGSAGASGRAASVCGGGSSRPGSVCGAGSFMGSAGAGGAANNDGADSWDSSTAVGSAAEDVGRVRAAIKHLEAGEVLAENPDMRGVHSSASVRSMLSRMEGAAN